MSLARILRIGLIVPALLVFFGLSAAAHAEPKHPHMHQALFELKETRTELKEAAHDFGGHRKEALEAVDAAIAEMEKALEGAGDKYKTIVVEKEAYKKFEFHPHIHRAIQELKDTQTELKEAKHDFGGHREKALKDVDYAIEQLKLALKFAKK
jgi:flagellar hook-basal body complex protein FliE